MKVTLYMAISLNGYIADQNGSEDFLSHANWEKFCSLSEQYGNFIVGRKTYEAVKNWNEGYDFDDLKNIKKIIISQDSGFQLDEGYILANSPSDALSKLNGSELVLVTGGSAINSAFIKENLIDEIIFNIEPALIGKGMPVFAESEFDRKLELVSSKQSEGLITVQYKVKK